MPLPLAVTPGLHLQWGVEPHSVDQGLHPQVSGGQGSVGQGSVGKVSVGREWSVVGPTTCT